MNETLDYYDKNAEVFVNGTADIEFSEMQDIFLAKLPAGATILDFGCGSGRDARYFLQKGYNGLMWLTMRYGTCIRQRRVLIPPKVIICRGGICILKSCQSWNICHIS